MSRLTSALPSYPGLAEKSALVLFAVAGCVLLVACLNIAGLLAARGEARAQEYAIRGVLGAGRLRLLRQAVTESLISGTPWSFT
ncbi:MAG: hypothetical protein GY856_53255 [bacterium]|nr:hypothetical protein [bacterium]